ncbi:hypothetical protein [Ekhidna sp.]|uniref:hypothetical protein n=1 Tax=Ekhidna sp. TaxID=2608089 RepID=UPI003C7B44D3
MIDRKQSIVVYFEGWINSLEPVHRLSEQFRELLSDNEEADFDGHEIAIDGSHGTLYFYCDDSKVLWKQIKSTLESADLLKCKQAILRLGRLEENAEQIIIDL